MGEVYSLISTHLDTMQYDAETQVLDIVFKDGSAYSYDNVPEDVALGLKSATHVSYYFRNYIKGRYKYYRA